MMQNQLNKLDVIVPFWKPTEWTSFDVVKKVRCRVKPNKVGHAGTLDPFAEGVLLLCIGQKTKQSYSLMKLEKEYIGNIVLGSETDTLDPTGIITKIKSVPKLNKSKVENVLKNYVGEIEQIPPMYSALKWNGQPLYKLARKGVKVKRVSRKVKVYSIEIINFSYNILSLKINCGKGTYIRSLAKDISASLGTCGHLKSLIRTRIGDFDKNQSIKINHIEEWLNLIQ